jgi:hypothetical protein
MTLWNKGSGKLILKNGKVVAPGATFDVQEDEAKKLLAYHHIVEFKPNGVAPKKEEGATPIPAGSGLKVPAEKNKK